MFEARAPVAALLVTITLSWSCTSRKGAATDRLPSSSLGDAGGPTGDAGDVWSTIDAGNDAGGREICGNGLDDDGNGRVDDGCACEAGQEQRCFVGPAAQAGIGACGWGNQSCLSGGEFLQGSWGACVGSGQATSEMCDGLDDNCDGHVDEGCACTEGDTRPCGSAVGACTPGTESCHGGAWSACVGTVGPRPEVCGDGADNNCDGRIDEGCSTGTDGGTGGTDAGTGGTVCPGRWSEVSYNEQCRSYEVAVTGDHCPWAICTTEASPVCGCCDGRNQSINGEWGEDCDTCFSPPCRMYRTTFQNCDADYLTRCGP